MLPFIAGKDLVADAIAERYTCSPMNYRRYFFALVLVLYAAAACAAQDLSNQLDNKWKGKYFVLKQCCAKNLTFNEQGELQTKPNDDLIPSAVLLKSLKVKGTAVEILVERGGLTFNPGGPSLGTHSNQQESRVTIVFGEGPISSERLDAALQKVFVLAAAKADRFPAYMQACARGQVLLRSGRWLCEMPGVSPVLLGSDNRQAGSADEPVRGEIVDFKLVDGRFVPENIAVYRVGKGVSAPRATYDPEPMYTDSARRERLSATILLRVVINEEGRTEHIQVVGPAGYGLDENAVEAVSTWRFQPSKYQGKPVPVVVNVEVTFRIG